MNPGDLVKLDTPGQRVNGKIGLVVSLDLRPYCEWIRESHKRFSYEVLVEGEVWRVTYDEVIEEEDWNEAG